MQGKYLGIDESNHGQLPEIFVGVLSDYLWDIAWKDKQFGKRRNRNQIEALLEGRDFRFVSISEEFGIKLADKDDRKIVAFTELLEYFDCVTNVYIDGDISDYVIAEVKKQLWPRMINTYYGPYGDRSWSLVNIADTVAYQLYKYIITQVGAPHDKYMAFEITPNERRYTHLFRKALPRLEGIVVPHSISYNTIATA